MEGRTLDADVDNELQRLFPYHRLNLLRDLGDHVAKLDVLEMQRHLAGFDLRQVEDVVDQREEMLRRGAAASQRIALAIVDVTEDAIDEQRRVANEGIDRRSQLVRHAGEKLR